MADSDEVISGALPGAEEFAARGTYSTVEEGIWIIDGVIERVAWTYFVYTIFKDFWVNWGQAISGSQGCTGQSGRLVKSNGLWQPIIPNATVPIGDFTDEVKDNIEDNPYYAVAVTKSTPGTVIASFPVTPSFHVTSWTIRKVVNSLITSSVTNIGAPAGYNENTIFMGRVPAGVSLEFVCRFTVDTLLVPEPPFINISNAHMDVRTYDEPTYLPILGRQY